MRLIDGDALTAWIKESQHMTSKMRNIICKVETMPSADRPQGEWIDMGDFEQCSVCKGTRLKEFQSYYGKVTWIKTPYCPHCGARMKGADDERDSLNTIRAIPYRFGQMAFRYLRGADDD